MRDLALLPKAHLHLHLEGAMRASTFRELATADHLELPLRDQPSFDFFRAHFPLIQAMMTNEARLRRLVAEVVEDAAEDGVVWLEASFRPGIGQTIGPAKHVVEVILDEGRRVGALRGVGFGLMVALNRNGGAEEALEMAHLAASMRDQGVVGLGLDGGEAGFPPEPFAEAFAVARAAGVAATPHAGETAGPASIDAALDALHADRILHGVRAIEDASLVQRLARSGICLDLCLTSNVVLGVVPSFEDHPLPALLRAGICCSLNADDPLPLDTSLVREYEIGRDILGLSEAELATIARMSLEASSAPAEVTASGLQTIEKWLE